MMLHVTGIKIEPSSSSGYESGHIGMQTLDQQNDSAMAASEKQSQQLHDEIRLIREQQQQYHQVFSRISL